MRNKIFRIQRQIITYQVKEVVAKTRNDALTIIEEEGDLHWQVNHTKTKIDCNPNKIRLIKRLEEEDE